jgi:phosphatidylglycerol:prolipoprotein diacylglycerol transferase
MLEQGARSIPVHPVQLYAAVFGWVFGALLYWYWPKRKGNGEVGALLVLGYSVFRFLIEFMRINPPVFSWAPFSISQWISMPAFFFAIWLLLVARGVLRSPATWLGPIETKLAVTVGETADLDAD